MRYLIIESPDRDIRGLNTRFMDHKRTSWFEAYKHDLDRYREYRSNSSILNIFITEQGLWALLQYRIASAVFQTRLPGSIKSLLLIGLVLWQKLIEILTGISISYKAKIGKGFYIGHFGNIFIGEEVEIGEICNISQGVTLGVAGRGAGRGMPRLGNRIYIGANAIIAGKIVVGDDAVIAANSLIAGNVSKKAVMMGVPARIISQEGSHDLLHPSSDTSFETPG